MTLSSAHVSSAYQTEDTLTSFMQSEVYFGLAEYLTIQEMNGSGKNAKTKTPEFKSSRRKRRKKDEWDLNAKM